MIDSERLTPEVPGDFPNPCDAYSGAPSVVREIGWVADQAANARVREIGREYWLRKAALVDRIALSQLEERGEESAVDATEIADAAALRLIECDEDPARGGHGPGSLRFSDALVGAGRRAYVRQQYLTWRRGRVA